MGKGIIPGTATAHGEASSAPMKGGVANSEEAYNLMYSLASQYEQGDPGRDPCLYEMAPRLGEEAAAVELYSRYR